MSCRLRWILATERVILRVTKFSPVSMNRLQSSQQTGTSAGALVVEENAVAAVHAVRLAVVDHDPVAVQLGHACMASARATDASAQP